MGGWFRPPSRDVRVRRTGNVRMRGGRVLIQSMSPPRTRRSSQIGTTQLLAKCGINLDQEKNGHPFGLGRTKSTTDMQFHVGRQLLDHVPFRKTLGTHVAGSDSGSRRVLFGPKADESMVLKKSQIFQLIPRQDVIDSLLKRSSRISDES